MAQKQDPFPDGGGSLELSENVHASQRGNNANTAVDIPTDEEALALLGASSRGPNDAETFSQKKIKNKNGLHSECSEDVEMRITHVRQKAVVEDECRICQSNGDETLISACKCSGSAKWVHQSCLVKWFQISHTSSCELCAHHVHIKKTTKPLSQWRLPRGNLGPCSRVDLWYLFVTVFSISTILGFCIFQILAKSKELETTVVFGAIYVLCGVMIMLRVRYFYQWFTRRSAFWRKWKTMNQLWTVASPSAVLETSVEAASTV